MIIGALAAAASLSAASAVVAGLGFFGALLLAKLLPEPLRRGYPAPPQALVLDGDGED